MKAVFAELPAFERHRADYLDDEAFQALQRLLMGHPEAGELIPDSGGLRKLRFADARRGKGKRGGLRVIDCGSSTTSGRRDRNSGSSRSTTRTSWPT